MFCAQLPNTRKAMSITVYSKPACVQCTATTRAL
ncbi:NrdH-redoxin, partial [Shinella zoogloeoides]